ncbi:hypothetical protein BDQ17DRAFT_1347127 [Cyathus striatus]|nr:hypothetical protein BDQ17DRAFT_1347127 [Cyathus striatus]
MPCIPSHLIILPCELQLHVLFFLGPLDILSLQRTCKHMHTMINMCEENAVFSPTYPIEEMTLRELRISATRPDRFLSFLEKSNPGQLLQPFVRQSIPFTGYEWHPDLYLVPGGRYLFTFFYNSFSLLDLGTRTSYPIILANANAICESYVVSTTCDGLGLRVILFGTDESENRSELNVFDIKFINVATLKHSGQIYMEVLCVCGEFAVLTSDKNVKIWNFITQKSTSWKVDDEFEWIVATDATVTTVSYAGIWTWRIPDLSFEPSALFLKDGKPLHPDSKVEFVDNFSHIGQFAGPCDWYTGMKMYHCHLFDIVESSWIGHNGVSVDSTNTYIPILNRFQLDASNSSDKDLSAHEPYLIQKYYLEPTPDIHEQVQPYRIVNSRLASIWHEGPNVDSDDSDSEEVTTVLKTKLHIGASGLSSFQVPGKQYTLFEGDPLILRLRSFTFCPISSRICYVSGSAGDVINVRDFVK